MRLRCVDRVRPYFLGAVHDLTTGAIARFVQVPRQLGLAVDHDGLAARQRLEVDAMACAIVRDEESVVNLTLAVHPLARPRLPHERGEAMLEHARANAAQNVR